MDYSGSDHRPVELILDPLSSHWGRYKQRIDRFAKAWLRYPELQGVVRRAWVLPSPAPTLVRPQSLVNLASNCMRSMAVWGRSKLGDFPKRISIANQRVQDAIADLRVSDSRDTLIQAETQLEEIL